MKKICVFILVLLVTLSGWAQVKTGIEVLKSQNFQPLEGKRVGLVTNPTGVDSNLKSTIDLLHEAPNVNLVALFGPEHGVRGNVTAGKRIGNQKDPRTGVITYSLYGRTLSPTAEMLKGIDVLVYDIQDIGCRSYTYISTLGNVMKAAAKYGIEVMVLDRPNPLGGLKVEGNLVESGSFSFVSKFKIPYVYGLTVGELAMYLNDNNMVGDTPCKLSVIKMEGWRRNMRFEDTGLPWVLASPHIPTAATSAYYVLSGIVGEVDNLSIGVGYTTPFRTFAADWIDAGKITDALNSLNIPGVAFRPICYKPYYGALVGREVQGVEVYITDYDKVHLSSIQFLVAQELYRLWPNHDFMATAKPINLKNIDLVCGSKEIRRLFMKHHKWADIEEYWNKDAEAFKEASKKYYLYR